MQLTRFGNAGLTVSRLCLGTMTFGLQTEEGVSIRILDAAAEGGINFLDTAARDRLSVYPASASVASTFGRAVPPAC